MSSPIADVLTAPPGALPLYPASFRIDVVYQPGMAPDDERREVLEEAFGELQEALHLGFFCGERFEARDGAAIRVSWRDDGGMSVLLSSAGVHYNALVAALRILVRLHHSSEQGYAALRELLGEDADALSPPTSFRENIAALTVSNVSGDGDNAVETGDLLNYVSQGIAIPDNAELGGGIGESYEGGRLIASSSDGDAFPVGDLAAIEDCFLRLFGTGVFTAIDDLDVEVPDNEAEIFTRAGDEATELLLGDYEGEKYGAIEFMNVVSGGRIGRLVIRSENDT